MAQISKDVSTEVLQGALLAVQDLRRKYKGEAWVNYKPSAPRRNCPLCEAAGFWDGVRHDACAHCPWVFIEGSPILTFTTPCESAQFDHRLQSLKEKFARIDRWEDAITEELAARRLEP